MSDAPLAVKNWAAVSEFDPCCTDEQDRYDEDEADAGSDDVKRSLDQVEAQAGRSRRSAATVYVNFFQRLAHIAAYSLHLRTPRTMHGIGTIVALSGRLNPSVRFAMKKSKRRDGVAVRFVRSMHGGSRCCVM